MGLPASQRRILERIDDALRGSDPRLAALFAIFTRLTRDEEMPRIEQVRARAEMFTAWFRYRIGAFGRWFSAPRRARLRAALFFPVALAIVASAVVLVDTFPGTSRCAAAPRTPGTAHPSARSKVCTPVIANPASPAILGR
jgi:hypothetical protein